MRAGRSAHGEAEACYDTPEELRKARRAYLEAIAPGAIEQTRNRGRFEKGIPSQDRKIKYKA